MTPGDRFWAKVSAPTKTGCMEWGGATNSRGYGCLGAEKTPWLAHRFAWNLLRGPIPNGLTIDHLCRNKLCVNVEHLEPVTNKTNVLRGTGFAAINAQKEFCDKGHELTGANLYVKPDGRRQCRRCKRNHDKRHLESVRILRSRVVQLEAELVAIRAKGRS